MRNKSILWIFVILLTIIVVYTLSYGPMARRYEKQMLQLAADSLAESDVARCQGDSVCMALYRKHLRDSMESAAYPVLGTTYGRLLENQLNLGLDLKGGMSATMEVSIPELLKSLSDNSKNADFLKSIDDAKAAQRSSTASFISLFADAWRANNQGKTPLWRVFDTIDNKGKFEVNSSDDEVIKVLQAEADDAINNTENIIKKRIDRFGIVQPNVQKQMLSGRLIVELPGVDDPIRMLNNLKSTANLEFWDTYRTDEIVGDLFEVFTKLGKETAPEFFSKDPDRDRKDSLFSVAMQVPDLTKEQQDSIRTVYRDTTVTPDSLLSKADLARKYPLGKLQINPQSQMAVLAFAAESDMEELNKQLNSEVARKMLPEDVILVWSAKPENGVVQLYGLKDPDLDGKADLDGENITDARTTIDPIDGQVKVQMEMDIDGASIWRQMTAKNAADGKRPIAIVMDRRVYSAPGPREEIANGSSVIEFGDGSNSEQLQQEASDLAQLLKAGSLPAPARVIDLVTIGPSLGDRNINAGIWSFFIAFVVILIYMLFYYAWAGWAANVALVANLFFMIGALIGFHGSLTLPGIAGIVLTMGMAVDANVLIYERVKEELRLGKGISAAMKDGFLKAVSAIIDGNATTLLTGIVLYIVGTGPIKGFATTLIIGIFTTLFTALIISRLILYRRLENKKPITFYSNITKNWFTKMNYDFVGKRKIFYVISTLVIGAGVASMIFSSNPFNYGVDFSGGTSARISYSSAVNEETVRNAVNATLIDANGQAANSPVQSVNNNGREFKIVTNYLMNSDSVDVETQVTAKLEEALKPLGDGFEMDQVMKVDASMSDDFRRQAFWAAIVSLILVAVYITIRFRKWDFAVGAAVALFHDALIVLSAFTLLKGIMPFSLEVNQNFIGAILTIIGYSINDTVVIFDRIREYFNTRRNAPVESTINDALNSTLGRSINTSMTVLLTLLVMFFFGGEEIRGFCFALIVGVVSGVYSTLFIASPIVVDMRRLFKSKNTAEAATEKSSLKAATA
ncbi:MAG: protein translocase subunit SecDF [Flavobacteriales bacterium]